MFMPMSLEMSKKLYENEIVYRPPLEATSILVDVSSGCKWSRCTFCRESVCPRYRVSDLTTIRRKLEIMSGLPGIEKHDKAFLLGEDVLALDMDFLVNIFKDIHSLLPHVRQINMYACARDVTRKGADNLLRLKALGLGDLYIGVESGSDSILKHVCKGASTKSLKNCFDLLDMVDVPYALSSIIGLGGRAHSEEHAVKTAEFYNTIHPKSIRIMTLTPVKGTKLYEEAQKGEFQELSPYEVLLEEKLFLQELSVENCLLIGTHISNNVPLLGMFTRDKQRLLAELEQEICSHDPEEWHKRDFENM